MLARDSLPYLTISTGSGVSGLYSALEAQSRELPEETKRERVVRSRARSYIVHYRPVTPSRDAIELTIIQNNAPRAENLYYRPIYIGRKTRENEIWVMPIEL